MNINKIENLNVHNNSETKEAIKDNIEQNEQEKKFIIFDKKITNLEVYMKEKIIDLIAQIENLRQLFLNTNKLPSFTTSPLFNFPNYNNNQNNTNPPQKMKEAHIVEIGAKALPPPTKVAKKYITNSYSNVSAKEKEKEGSKEINNMINNLTKNDINLPKDITQRIKTGKNPTYIKTIMNRTLQNNNNTIIFSNMANDFNSKFLKGVEKRAIGNENKYNNMNKFIELNKINNNYAMKTQNNIKYDANIFSGDNNLI